MKKLLFLSFLLFFFFNTYAQKIISPLVNQLLHARSAQDKTDIIFRLAEIDGDKISVFEQETLKKELLKWYVQEPDAGLHSAIDYLVRPAKKGESPRKINWNLSDKLAETDRALVKKNTANKRWFVNAQLHTMSIVSGPITYHMGSPINEQYRTDDELPHHVSIPRSFAISTKEVTVAQFQEFLNENPLIKKAARSDSMKYPSTENKRLLVFSPELDCPQIYVTWYEATQYCNWLSKKDGIPASEWCYPANEMIKSGMEIQKGYLNRKGYRLPTEAEWEYACKAGANTSRFYGDSDSLLTEYAWYSKNPPIKKNDSIDPLDPPHTYPVGQLKPNALGLFDIYGNVWEWCDSRRLNYENGVTIDEPAFNIIITDSVAMIRRGGSFSYGKDVMRSAHRGATNYYPNQRRDNVGFRIAKTM